MESMETSPSIPSDAGVDISPKRDGGVLKKIIKEGSGTETPAPGSKVIVHYVGTLMDGTKFDSSRDRDSPFEFNLGKGSVIKAWDIGVATMKKGEVAVFTCAPEYAYGKSGSPPKIPPDSTLIFEVEAIDWQGEDLSVRKDGGVIRYILEEGEEYLTPNDGALVQVHLTGKCNGNVFEDRDVSFPLGEGSEYGICEGLERALEKFKQGEKSRILIKSKYAYKDKGNPALGIPPNADIEYVAKMNSFEKVKESWSLDSDGKLEQAKLFKEKGTNYFKNNKYPLAIKMYKRLNTYVEHDSGFEGKQEEERKTLLLAGHLNLAMCYLKLDQFVEARNACDSALQLDPNNVKGLFRRGQAFLGMGEPELAKNDFEAVLKIEPKNAAAVNHIAMCIKAAKEQKSREKTIYANMFEKFAKRDKENPSDLVNGWWDGKTVIAEKDDELVPKLPPKKKVTLHGRALSPQCKNKGNASNQVAAGDHEKLSHEATEGNNEKNLKTAEGNSEKFCNETAAGDHEKRPNETTEGNKKTLCESSESSESSQARHN